MTRTSPTISKEELNESIQINRIMLTRLKISIYFLLTILAACLLPITGIIWILGGPFLIDYWSNKAFNLMREL